MSFSIYVLLDSLGRHSTGIGHRLSSHGCCSLTLPPPAFPDPLLPVRCIHRARRLLVTSSCVHTDNFRRCTTYSLHHHRSHLLVVYLQTASQQTEVLNKTKRKLRPARVAGVAFTGYINLIRLQEGRSFPVPPHRAYMTCSLADCLVRILIFTSPDTATSCRQDFHGQHPYKHVSFHVSLMHHSLGFNHPDI